MWNLEIKRLATTGRHRDCSGDDGAGGVKTEAGANPASFRLHVFMFLIIIFQYSIKHYEEKNETKAKIQDDCSRRS